MCPLIRRKDPCLNGRFLRLTGATTTKLQNPVDFAPMPCHALSKDVCGLWDCPHKCINMTLPHLTAHACATANIHIRHVECTSSRGFDCCRPKNSYLRRCQISDATTESSSSHRVPQQRRAVGRPRAEGPRNECRDFSQDIRTQVNKVNFREYFRG